MDEIMFVLELIGAAAFAVSGAMVAIEKRADIFGILFLAVTTALGGGVIRDVLIGRIPPVMFVSYWYLLISVVAALAVFIDAYLRSEKYKLHLDKLDAVNNIFDAIGLAVFTVSGMNAAMPVSDNVILVLFVGMCTGVGGGMLRDTLIRQMPFVLRKHVYAVAAIAGAMTYALLTRASVHSALAYGAGWAVTVSLRMLATVFRWNLPKAFEPGEP